MTNEKIRIRLRAYDHRVLDQSATEIVDTARRTGARVLRIPAHLALTSAPTVAGPNRAATLSPIGHMVRWGIRWVPRWVRMSVDRR